MPTANSIITPQTPVSYKAVATTAETSFHAPTNVQVLIDETVDTQAHLLDRVYAIARAALAGNVNCNLYEKVGTTYTLIDSVLMSSGTPSATVANQKADFGYTKESPLELKAGVGLAFSIGSTIANGIVCRAQGGKY